MDDADKLDMLKNDRCVYEVEFETAEGYIYLSLKCYASQECRVTLDYFDKINLKASLEAAKAAAMDDL